MSDYKITIRSTYECGLRGVDKESPTLVCWYPALFKHNGETQKCVGLGQSGCPFQPMPSCETCGHNCVCDKEVIYNWTDEGKPQASKAKLCSAYILEVK